MPYETDERVAELTERLENGVKELYASDSYAQYITAMAKFHHYSFGNALLILFQCPSASNVAGYNTWKQLGRQVKKGEKGIMILAPCSFRASLEREKIDPLTGQTLLGPDGNPLTEKVKIAPNRFKIAHVFDLSQTEGRELPQIGVSELTGDVADYTGIYDRLTAISPLPVVQEDFQRSAKGYTSFTENRVVVKPGMSQVQTIKTLVHEIAHAKLHRPDDILAIPTPSEKRQKEVEAESIAYVVCQHFGIDTSDYSLAYVAGWSRGKELTELKSSLNVIHATAGEIIDAISPPPPKLERQLSQAPEKKPNLIYDGTEKTLGVTVMRAGTELTVGTDYTVAYSDNKNAGENKATVTVTIGNGQGSYTEKFTIDRATPTITWSSTSQELTYTGQQAVITAPTVTLVNNESFGGTIHYSYTGTTSGTGLPTNAGTYTIMASITAEGNYTNAQTATPLTLTINKAQAVVTGDPTANTLTYTGAAQALVTAGTASVGEVVYSLTETGTYSSTIPTGTDAGSYTVWYKVEGTTNYDGTDPVKVDVTIAQATAPVPQTGTLNVQNGQNRDYTYNLSRLLPVLTSGQSFGGDVTYTLKSVNITEAGYYEIGTAVISGTTLTLPIKAVTSSDEGRIGTITVTISSKNFADVEATINVNRVNKQPVSIEGVTAQNGTYNGKSHSGYTGTPTASPYSGGFTVTYAKADGTALSGAPTNAGDYTVTITLNENNDYTGSRTLSFTISKASITIKADDKRADVGAAKPTLTYTVTGLVSGDTLATAPTLTCDADMDTIGQYPITASGAAVPSGGNYNTTITYVAGTLNVTNPTIPVTGVTLNKTSTTLTVGGSERLTATVAPSDATDKSVTWASSNTSVATVDASGNITAVSAGTATITVTTADGAKTATCSVTVRSNSGGGSSYVPSTPSNPSTSTITVPVSGDKDTVRVSASVSGTTATVSKIDTSQIENVIGDNGQASMVEIDFTGLGKTIDTVKLPAAAIKDIAAKAQNEEVRGLTVKLPEVEISFDAKALSAIQAQASNQITLTVTPAKPADLNSRQKEAVGSAPVFDLTLRSSSGAITDFRGGYATVSLPYTLTAGQNPSGVVVYYLDSTGNITPCTTMYDVRSKSAIFTTGHLSLYFVGYDPAAVWVNPFSDVAGDAWYYDAVRYASENGLMGGYGNGKFGPNDNLSRAQFVQILFNKEGRPVVNYLLRYNDVADGAWYTEAVRWATSQGVVSGYGNGMFGPNDNITREQLAVMLWRYAGSPAATEKELHFTDADKASGYALEALRWAVENGVMGGYGNGQLAPQGLATRAQVAQMLMNFLKNK